MEFTLLGNAAIAAAAGWVLLRWEARRGNAAGCAGDLWETAIVAAVAGVLGGRLMAMVADGVAPWLHPADVLLVRAGVSTVGASLTAGAVFLFIARREPLAMADGVAASALAALAGWHGGCLTRDACLGTASNLPWAVAQAGSTVTRHPVEIYAAILFIAAAVLLALWKAYGRPPPGVPASLAMAAAGGVRLLTEPMRPSLSGGPVGFYVLALVLGAASALFFLTRTRAKGLRDSGTQGNAQR